MVPVTHLAFTPVEASLGGLILGVAVLGKMSITGRTLGVSGIVKGLLKNVSDAAVDWWRVAFVGGLLVAGFAHRALFPEALAAEASLPWARSLAAGVLVGLGSGLGNGCTSGHGICGNMRFSLRSMAYTVVFMVAGAAVATITDTAGALSIAAESAIGATAFPAADAAMKWLGIAVASGIIFSAVAVAPVKPTAGKAPAASPLATLTDAAAGLVFGIGLLVSGMVRPVKVAGFLSVTAPCFDPSLMLVMGGALALCVPVYHLLIKPMRQPACALSFDTPAKKSVDARLMAGGVLFGAGWGYGGMCPGPAIVAVGAMPSAAVGAWMVGFVAALGAVAMSDKAASGRAVALADAPAGKTD